MPLTMTWWHGAHASAYFSPVDDASESELLEISCTSFREPEVPGRTVSWGIPATSKKVLSLFEVRNFQPKLPMISGSVSNDYLIAMQDFDQRVNEALSQVPEGQWREFSIFAGSYPERLTAWDKVVLIGDASHPLAGSFSVFIIHHSSMSLRT